MLLGIDYGTTRTVVAAVDRGNYPVVSFHTADGDTQDWYPSLITVRGDARLYGLDAARHQDDPDWVLLRSLKRQLATLGPAAQLPLGAGAVTALELLTAFLAQLRRDLVTRSNLRLTSQEPLEAVIAVPANANSNQRFLTLEAFRRAGFQIRGLLNEPSAAGIEYAHHARSAAPSARRELVVVYDLGGGTFDASIISMAARRHEVVRSAGIAQLGGDDVDTILLELALAQAGPQDWTAAERARLLEECREKKEGLHPNTRRLAIDLERGREGTGTVVVSTSAFYECCQPLVARTLITLEEAMQDLDWGAVAALYVVGGASALPLVGRLLRERYGRKVRTSPYPHAATAIGLAIAADQDAGYQLQERFTRHFGVWREAEDGRAVAFDVVFGKDCLLPAPGDAPLARHPPVSAHAQCRTFSLPRMQPAHRHRRAHGRSDAVRRGLFPVCAIPARSGQPPGDPHHAPGARGAVDRGAVYMRYPWHHRGRDAEPDVSLHPTVSLAGHRAQEPFEDRVTRPTTAGDKRSAVR
jgi:molecular chaperone DnaK (HSP70)